jgi:hypothetical protein
MSTTHDSLQTLQRRLKSQTATLAFLRADAGSGGEGNLADQAQDIDSLHLLESINWLEARIAEMHAEAAETAAELTAAAAEPAEPAAAGPTMMRAQCTTFGFAPAAGGQLALAVRDVPTFLLSQCSNLTSLIYIGYRPILLSTVV